MPYNPPSIIDDVTTGEALNWLTWFEDIYDQAVAASGGSGTPQSGIFLPETYGAVMGGPDCTSALQQCWDAMVAAEGGTMLLGPGTYFVNTPPTTLRGGNSIIALWSPSFPATAADHTYRIKGIPRLSRIQTTAGIAAGAYGTGGPPSVVGGTTFEGGGGVVPVTPKDFAIHWSGVDIYVVVDGSGPKYSGLDLGKFTRASVEHSRFSSTNTGVVPTRKWTFGLHMPTGTTYGEADMRYVNSKGFYANNVIHTAHTSIHHCIPKWGVINWAIDDREPHDHHMAETTKMNSEWANYHLAAWEPVGGVKDMDNTRQFWITGNWDIEDANPIVTLTDVNTNATAVISTSQSIASVVAGQYVVSTLFPLGTVVNSKATGTPNTITCSNPAFGTQTAQTIKFGAEWWYTTYHIFDLNNRIRGHLNYHRVLGDVGIQFGALTNRGGDALGQSEVATLQGSIPPAARVYNSAALPVLSSQSTALTFNSERFDTRGLHSTAVNPSRLTVPVAGIYQVTAHIQWEANVTGYRQMLLLVNGAAFASEARPPITTGVVTRMSIASVMNFAAGDYVEVQVFQNSTVSLNVEVSGAASPELAMTYLGNVT